MTLDDQDFEILRQLQRDATQTASQLARKMGLSQPAMWRRIKRLQDAGIIAGRELLLDAEKVVRRTIVRPNLKVVLHFRHNVYTDRLCQ